MLTQPIARAFWHKLAAAPPEWFERNLNLCARAVLLVYRKEGAREARTLLHLIRTSIIVGI